jgi:hypothetical protein
MWKIISRNIKNPVTFRIFWVSKRKYKILKQIFKKRTGRKDPKNLWIKKRKAKGNKAGFQAFKQGFQWNNNSKGHNTRILQKYQLQYNLSCGRKIFLINSGKRFQGNKNKSQFSFRKHRKTSKKAALWILCWKRIRLT